MTSINVQRDVILLPLQSVSGVVERRHTLPILSNVLLELQAGILTLTATDLEIQVASRNEADGASGQEATTVSARKLQDILRALPEGSTLALDIQDKRLQIKAGKSRFSLQTLPAPDFPKLAAAGGAGARLELKQRELKRLLGLVHYSMAVQDIRYYLNGLLLAIGPEGVTVVATDGHRLALASLPGPLDTPAAEVILPRKAVLELTKLLGDNDASIEIQVRDNQAAFSFGVVELVTKLVDGKFPDYQKVVPSGYRQHFSLDRLQLQQALHRAAILSNEKFRGVRWVITENSLRIVSSNSEQEEAEEEIEIEYSGAPLDVGFNVSYLLDVLANVSSRQIQCWLGDSNSSMLMTVPEDANFKYVVMPMRI
jgi:DNA polymerase III subunit beta